MEPNAVLGVPLPGPRGSYALDQFRGVEVEFRSGRPSTDPNAAGPHELLWLMGRPGTPNLVLARTQNRAGRALGQEVGACWVFRYPRSTPRGQFGSDRAGR